MNRARLIWLHRFNCTIFSVVVAEDSGETWRPVRTYSCKGRLLNLFRADSVSNITNFDFFKVFLRQLFSNIQKIPAKIKKSGSGTHLNAEVDSQIAAAVDALQKLRVVVRAAQRHSNWIKKQCGVTGAQLWLMHELHATPDLRVGDLAERLAIHQTTTSNMLNSLVRRKLLVKKRESTDQRAITLALTRRGRVLVAKASKPARGLLPEALHNMSRVRLNDLRRGLQGLLDKIGRTDEALGKEPLPLTM